MDPTSVFISALVAGGVAWKTGLAEMVIDKLALRVGRSAEWFGDEEGGSWASLPEQLDYRDFYGDVVETKDGWMWAGLELRPLPTDGFSNADWNLLGNRLNTLYTVLEDRTWVQVITKVDFTSSEAEEVLRRMADRAREAGRPEMELVVSARQRYLRREAGARRLKRVRTFIYLGRQGRRLAQKIPLSGFVSSKAFVDLEREDYLKLREEVVRARDTVRSAWASLGGASRVIGARQVYDDVYARLNPERAEHVPAPAYVAPLSPLGGEGELMGDYAPAVEGAAPPRTPEPAGSEFDDVMQDLARDGILDGLDFAAAGAPAPVASGEDEPRVVHDAFLSEVVDQLSPREMLCFTPIRVNRGFFDFGGRPLTTVSLHRLPKRTFAGLAEYLTRNNDLNFPFEIATNFLISDQQAQDEKFEGLIGKIRLALRRSGGNPDQKQEDKRDELVDIRRQASRGGEKYGEVGLGVTFAAGTPSELRQRRNQVYRAMRAMEGCEGIVEQHNPLPQFMSTLPCTPHRDARRRLVLTRDGVALSPLTGGTTGTPAKTAVDVLLRADGGYVYWNPADPSFNTGFSIFCGQSRSGKSGGLNRQRSVFLSAGRRGVSIDLGGSSWRPCRAVGGRYVDITDPVRCKGLGLFAIRPRPDEHYEPEELTEAEGLPLDRLGDVEELMEMLCLDPSRPQERGLPPEEKSYLCKTIRRTYLNLVDETPGVDDFIRTLRRARKEDKPIADRLAARLELFASSGSLGRFLNDKSEPFDVDVDYTVFDFRGALDNPRLMLVASMAVRSFVARFLRVDRSIEKFVDIDEFDRINRYPLIVRTVDGLFRTAGKLNAHCSVASQDPTDFVGEDAKGLRASAEVLWLFSMPRVERAAEVFELPVGVTRMLRGLNMSGVAEANATDDFTDARTTRAPFKDCVLVWPGGNGAPACAHLRMRFNALDRRLLLGAGREVATLDEALEDTGAGAISKRLYAALTEDGLGMTRVPGTKDAVPPVVNRASRPEALANA